MSECEHEWHIEGRDIFVQCWHNLEHTLTVEQVETMLNEHAQLEEELGDFRDRRDEKFQMYEDCKAENAALKRELDDIKRKATDKIYSLQLEIDALLADNED